MLPKIDDPKLAKKAKDMKLEEEVAKAREIARQIKKRLKVHSKSELIHIIIDQASRVQELQQACKQLLAENKKLKGTSNEEITPSTDANEPVQP